MITHSGSIPACAGEPLTPTDTVFYEQVYPRVCGGTIATACGVVGGLGLSPRVRGNLIRRVPNRALPRSIPACAGEPGRGRQSRARGTVYPRVCGGTRRSRLRLPSATGLSPRVRGNRERNHPALHVEGSIPACAGEPKTVYMRSGMSRSIPACAGEPRSDTPS